MRPINLERASDDTTERALTRGTKYAKAAMKHTIQITKGNINRQSASANNTSDVMA